MQMIRHSVLQLWQTASLTSKEVDFLLYILRGQNDAGKVVGVNYRKICEVLDISIQTFYNIKKSLTQKSLISACRVTDIDYDIWLVGNTITVEDYINGYIHISDMVFEAPEFRSLKAPEKLLLLDLMENTCNSYGKFVISLDAFNRKYMNRYSVAERILRGYMGNLRTFFHIIVKDKKYIIIPKEIWFVRKVEKDIDALVLEYMSLSLQYISYQINKESGKDSDKGSCIKRILEIRELLDN